MSDEDAIYYLSNLRQIGRWSAEMILLFTYNRSNIWPVQDIGLLRAISKNYKKNHIKPPSVVVVGEVVNLRQGLDWLGAENGKLLINNIHPPIIEKQTG